MPFALCLAAPNVSLSNISTSSSASVCRHLTSTRQPTAPWLSEPALSQAHSASPRPLLQFSCGARLGPGCLSQESRAGGVEKGWVSSRGRLPGKLVSRTPGHGREARGSGRGGPALVTRPACPARVAASWRGQTHCSPWGLVLTAAAWSSLRRKRSLHLCLTDQKEAMMPDSMSHAVNITDYAKDVDKRQP